ncbi:hypothetical protein PORCRE_1326 [Porphyromonas crevioricanis JCM 15906]|uniref:Uncharacterized protein n=1 Tax=Porphyromonas crevioricanis JCM 15906 TaxID=1305617 RepID=T1CHY2_9PORP|nr:hypothetical protein PORCRE_1326 [Porphyromonas crevioricanis JCM 15906]
MISIFRTIHRNSLIIKHLCRSLQIRLQSPGYDSLATKKGFFLQTSVPQQPPIKATASEYVFLGLRIYRIIC